MTLAPFNLPVISPAQAAPVTAPPRAPDEVRVGRRLIDSHGRTIRDLRISITDRCNFRCVYCMEPDVRFRPHEELLTTEQVVRLARVAESLGVRKIRLTGGEPTLRTDLEEMITGIRAATAVEIALITNGSLIDRPRLRRWKQAGLDRVTMSIDSLNPARFARITRSTATPAMVVRAIEDCLAEGLTPLKVNAVLIRGFNEDEAPELAALARRWGIEMRFIEFMPLDSGHAWDASKVVSAAETLRQIRERFPLAPTGDDGPSSTSVNYRFTDMPADFPGRIGLIAPVTNPFCGACSRLRITSDGKVRPCLFSTREWDLSGLLREGASDEQLARFLLDATWTKQAGHGVTLPGFAQPERPMSAIGG